MAGIVSSYIDARNKIIPAQRQLATAPNDPTANLTVGRFDCFYLARWDDGLPLLAKSNDAQLKGLAISELGGTGKGSEDKVKLADDWLAVAGRLPPFERAQVTRHAASLYRSAEAGLVGLERLAVEKKLAVIAGAGRPRRIDLIKMFDASADVVKGDWQVRDGALVCDATPDARIFFPYEPPEEYDFQIAFTVLTLKDAVVPICCFDGHQFMFVLGGWSNRVAAFQLVDGSEGKDNKTTKRRDRWLTQGQHYTILLKVRKAGAEAYVNGQLVTTLKTDYSNVSINGYVSLPYNSVLGISAISDSLRIDTAELVEISGAGKSLTQ